VTIVTQPPYGTETILGRATFWVMRYVKLKPYGAGQLRQPPGLNPCKMPSIVSVVSIPNTNKDIPLKFGYNKKIEEVGD